MFSMESCWWKDKRVERLLVVVTNTAGGHFGVPPTLSTVSDLCDKGFHHKGLNHDHLLNLKEKGSVVHCNGHLMFFHIDL